ncbi:MAG: hypothetical protein MUF66_02335 [Gammaproteobacteria bacterium]|nr:hypothetical protein [Gammaproteobacteria bacterium]
MDANRGGDGAPDPVGASVEALCLKGCRSVLESIARLERGESLPEVAALGVAERTAVLRELRSIMAVYGDACRLP